MHLHEQHVQSIDIKEPMSRLSKYYVLYLCVFALYIPARAQTVLETYKACEDAIFASDTAMGIPACALLMQQLDEAPEADTIRNSSRFYHAITLRWNNQTPAAIDSMEALAADLLLEFGCGDDYVTVMDVMLAYMDGYASPTEEINTINTIIACSESLYTDSSEFVMTYYYLGAEAYLLSGDYAASIQYFEKAKSIHKKIYQQPDAFYARILVEMSSPYLSISRYQQSIDANLEALRVLDSIGDTDYTIRTDAYQLLSWSYMGIDSVETALDYVLRQIDLADSLDEVSRAGLLVGSALIIINFDIDNGTTIAKENNFTKLLHQALDIYSHIQIDPVYISNVYIALGNYYSVEQNVDSVLHYYSKSAQLLESAYGRNNVMYLNALSTLAIYSAQSGLINNARVQYDLLDELSQNFLSSNFLFLSEQEQESFLTAFERYQLLRFNFYMSEPSLQDTLGIVLFNSSLFMKGLLLQNITALRTRVHNMGSENDKEVFEQWLQVKQELADAIMQNSPQSKSLMETAEQYEKQLLKSGLTDLTVNYQFDWQSVQKQLTETDAVVEITRCYTEGTELYYAVVLTATMQKPVAIPLMTGELLSQLFMRNAGETEPDYINRVYGMYDPEFGEDSLFYNGHRLYRHIWKPILPYLTDVYTVYISVDGMFHQIALHAIPDEKGSAMLQDFAVIYINTTRELPHTSKKSFKAEKLLLVGGLDYNDAFTTSNWTALPGTLTEVSEIAQLAKLNSVDQKIADADKVSELFFRTNAPQYPVIHLATHAFVLSPDTLRIGFPGNAFAIQRDPLMRTGLVLSESSSAWMGKSTPGISDNLLTAYEITGMQLHPHAVVVLSACETGLGDLTRAEGVYGLQRAFRIAGAETLVMSLWKVPDIYTAECMRLFYSGLFEGKQPQDALRRAQLVLQQKSSPYYWAAFKIVQ